MRKFLLFLMMLAFALPAAIAGEKTVTISRNEGIYDDGTGVYYCTKGGITMTFSSGLNNVNYLVEHQQVVFDIFSTNYVIKKIKFNCLDNTTDDNLDCFYWGPSTISEFTGAPYVPTGTYTWSGYIGTWVGGSTPSKYVKFVTEAKPVRFGSVEITYDKEFGDIYDLVRYNTEIQNGQTYALVSKYDSRAFGKEEYHGDDPVMTFSSTPVTLLDFDTDLNNYLKVKVTDEVSLMKLESSGNSSRPWYIKIGDNYLRRRTGDMQGSGGPANGQGWNVYTVSNVPSGSETYFRTSITVENNNNNALIRFEHNSTETNNGSKYFAIRHYNGGDLFRVIDYNTSNNQYSNNQRVFLYKPAQSYEVTTECIPTNGGYITLDNGILTDSQGRNWSQHFDNVTFFVGPTNGWGVGEVTLTDINSKAVTTLQPTSTSDFGNDYSFEMPANDVKITANFLQPYNIDTICNPNANAGEFNFIDGYTDFNGQHKSNEGKTVTFKPVAADGYIFNSVTYYDNATGQTTTLTPDADGVYSFVMPGNDVTLTANFEEAHDLYLLGTANGGDWAPSGPKFIFDGENQEYYLDVYYKGNVSTGDHYGHFSLTTRISDNWNDIANYRLVASSNDYDVWDGQTADLYKTSDGANPNYAFRIPAGVYRITVNQAMTQVSISEYPLTVTFDPVSGTVVESGDNVSFTSNLNDLVHAINDQEDAATYSSTDNWGVQASGNTHAITQDGITTVTGQSSIGYITATGTADYEIIGDLYLLGTALGRRSWAPSGPKFTYDADNEQYYIDVYFRGGVDGQPTDDEIQGYGYFSLATHVSDFDWKQRTQTSNDWSQVTGRLAAVDNNTLVGGGDTGIQLYSDRPNNAFKIPAGVYRIIVNKAKTQMSIEQTPVHITFTPPTGTTVESGQVVTLSSDIQSYVWSIAESYGLTEVTQDFRIKTDDDLNWSYSDNDAVINKEGETTVYGVAYLGYITVEGTAVYTILPPPVYDITTVVSPEGAGTIDAPAGSLADETVTFTVTTNEGYLLDGVQVVNSLHEILPLTDNGDGTYSFTMPDDNVTIYADYLEYFDITVVTNPADGGSITLAGDDSVLAGETVTFTVTTNDGYALSSVLVIRDSNQHTVNYTDNGDGTYTFTMPEGDVTIVANFNEYHDITAVTDPPEGGSVTLTGDDSALAGETVTFTVTPNDGYAVNTVVVTNDNDGSSITIVDNGDGTYSFTMPDDDVTIHVDFLEYFDITVVTNPAAGGSISLAGDDSVLAGETVTFTVTTNDGYALSTVLVTLDGTQQTVDCTDNGDGTYTFTMPEGDVTIVANFNEYHDITVVAIPPEYGSVTLNGEDSALAGETVTFTVTPNNGYQATSVVVTIDDGGSSITIVDNGDGTYSFTMPDADVTITAVFDEFTHNITTVCDPVQGGSITLAGDAADGNERVDQTVNFTVNASELGYTFESVTVVLDSNGQTVALTDNGDGTYSFVMPDEDVTITAHFALKGEIFRLVTKTSEIIEGKAYIYVSQPQSKVMASASVGEFYPTIDIVEWVTPDKRKVKVDGRAAFFKPFFVVDTLGRYKAACLKTIDGCFIGYDGFNTKRMKAFAELPNSTNHYTNDTFRLVMGIDTKVNPADGFAEYLYLYSSYNDDDYYLAFYDNLFIYRYIPTGFNEHVNLYKLAEPYNITAECTPDGSGQLSFSGDAMGTIAIDGDTVIVTPIPGTGYAFDDVTGITVTVDDTGETIEVIDNGNGTYSFVMPIGDVTVSAEFVEGYTITTICDPVDGGQFEGLYITSAYEGQEFEFTVVPSDNYVLDYVTFVYEDSGDEEPGEYYVESLPSDGNRGTDFWFEMPAEDVTIIAHFKPAHHITFVVEPTDDAGNVFTRRRTDNGFAFDVYFANAEQVYLTVQQNGGYLLDSVKVVRDDNGQRLTLVNPGQEAGSNEFLMDYFWNFDMPDADVTVTAYFSPYTPLKYIENFLEGAKSGDEVVVSDTLIVVWVAKDIMWAKDLAKSNDYVEQPQGTYDYVKLNMNGFQTDNWDQSNWVMLDGSNLYPDLDETARRHKLDEFVDHKIVPGTVKGTYFCEGGAALSTIAHTYHNKVNHTIELSEPPVAVPYPNNHPTANSFGYPGYMQDPRELIQDYHYMYNHYMPTNFNTDYMADPEEGCVFTSGDQAMSFLDAPVDFFFMAPKDQEVAQVWAVYHGYYEDKNFDLFTVYEYYRQGGVTQNSFDLPGNFIVQGSDWCFNRLRPEWGDNVYGRPGSLDGGVGALKTDTAYLFHIAIRRLLSESSTPRGVNPDTASDSDLDSDYLIFPLDADSHQGTITTVHEVMAPGSTEIVSITYYNTMGQESSKPFDGINIRVIRYKDGSFSSSKILMR